MKELTPFLEQLASKLGTTVEKLWAVLLKQAPISGTIDLMVCIGLVLVAVKCFRFVNRKTTVPAETEKDQYPNAQWEEEGAGIAWVGIGLLLLTIGLIIIFSVNNIAAAFLNPEYWALKEILGAFKK
jgi:hypothetical protein